MVISSCRWCGNLLLAYGTLAAIGGLQIILYKARLGQTSYAAWRSSIDYNITLNPLPGARNLKKALWRVVSGATLENAAKNACFLEDNAVSTLVLSPSRL